VSTMDDQQPSPLGGTVGGRLAQMLSQATVLTRQRLGPHTAAVAEAVFTNATNHVSDEVRGVLGDMFRRLADDPGTPKDFKPLLSALGRERGQAWAWIGGSLASSALSPGLGSVFSNSLGPIFQAVIAETPNSILTPESIAAMLARDIGPGFDWEREAAKGGLGPQRLAHLVSLAGAPLRPEHALDIARRGPRPDSTAAALLRQGGMYPPHIDRFLELINALLSPETLAAMWNRDIVDMAHGKRIAAMSGVSGEDFERLTLLGGDPPAPQELLLAWRRQIISESDVDRALIQGPLRKEWIDVIKSLQWNPLPVGEAADAVNQNHMSIEDALAVARENGVRDKDFNLFVANAGIPPGPQTILDWRNRDLITDAQALQGLYESRIKNSWVPTYLASRHETMPPETVRLMFSRGAITPEDALRRLQARGYSPDDASIILDGATAEKTAVERDLTVANIRELYADRALSTVEATALLTELGYSPDESGWILLIADMQRIRRFSSAIMTRVRSGYVSGQLDANRAIAALDAAGIPSEQRDDAMALWDIERTTVTRGLTLAQLQSAYKKGFLERDAFRERVFGMGYSSEDTDILVGLTAPAA